MLLLNICMPYTETFQTPIYIGFNTESHNEILFNTINSMYASEPSDAVSNDGGWQSANKQTGLIDSTIKHHFQKYLQSLGNTKLSYNITSEWVNVNPPGTSNLYHTHGDCDFSGVFYVSAPKDCGDIVFHNAQVPPNNLSHLFPNVDYFKSVKRFTPEDNMIIIFPGNLPHSVCSNMSPNNRLSIAFNISIDK
jgi:uncharacterized protein (TIGR02466 family)